ncbi:MAG: ATP-grasp domain-containing protein [Chloroflexota bacterium]|nr:ATP-grasp domain-containing protein [Chloroflexota bacterium]
MGLAINQRGIRRPFGKTGAAIGNESLLVTEDAPAYGVLAGVRALRARGYRPWVAVAGAATYSARSRAREGTVLVPDPAAGVEEYVSRLAEIAARLRVAAVLPGTENGLLALAGTDQAFGTDIVVGAPSRETVRRVTDKAVLVDLAPRVGLRAPPTLAVTADHLDEIDDFDYPVIAKTSRTKTVAEDGTIISGMVRRVDTPGDLRSAVSSMPDASWLIQPYIRGVLTAVSGVAWKGDVICSHHQVAERIYPVDCGISAYAISVVADPELDRSISKLVSLLDWSGLFQVQLLRNQEDIYVIDVNPRMYGSLALAIASGLNLPAIWVDVLLGRRPVVGRSRAAARYRSEERDAGALWATLAQGNWRGLISGVTPRRGTTHAIFSIRDPLPLLASVRHLHKARTLFRVGGRSSAAADPPAPHSTAKRTDGPRPKS